MRTAKAQSLIDALEPTARDNDLEVVDVEVVGSKKSPTIRIYLDGPQGVGFDELAAANVWIDRIVEAIDPFPGAYTLEVSSPGIDRPLRTREHFERFAGEAVTLGTASLHGRNKWNGILAGVRGDDVVLTVDGHEELIPLKDIKKANVKGRIDFSDGKDQ